ncbi:hypothetical protein M8J76_000388 [Diaphorina citri]|nr:hypothetical protein M8J76_000388 [Diaphorina citri]
MEENHNTDAKESFLQKDSTNNGTETEKQVRYGTRSACSQIMVAVVQNFLLIAVGMSFGMPTVIVGALDHKVATNQTKMESPNLIMSDEESSWKTRSPSSIQYAYDLVCRNCGWCIGTNTTIPC